MRVAHENIRLQRLRRLLLVANYQLLDLYDAHRIDDDRRAQAAARFHTQCRSRLEAIEQATTTDESCIGPHHEGAARALIDSILCDRVLQVLSNVVDTHGAPMDAAAVAATRADCRRLVEALEYVCTALTSIQVDYALKALPNLVGRCGIALEICFEINS